MRATFDVFQHEIKVIGLRHDFRSEEEEGILDLVKASKDRKIDCSLHEFLFDDNTIPMLVISPYERYITTEQLSTLNGNEVIRLLESAKNNFDYMLRKVDDKKKTKFPLPMKKSVEENNVEKTFYISEQSTLLASFFYGEHLVLFPNPYLVSFEVGEYKAEEGWHEFTMIKRKREALKERIQERRIVLFNQLVSEMNSLYMDIRHNGCVVGGVHEILNHSINLIVMSSENREILLNEKVFPFERGFDKNLYEIHSEVLKAMIEKKVLS